MSPIRLAILAGLFYIGWRLLRGMGTKNQPESRQNGSGAEKPGTESPVRDVLVEDPICKSLVPRNQAIRLKHEDIIFYFCSEECCDEFTQKIQRREK